MKTAEINVDLIDHCGTDLSIVNAARVSFHKESEWGGGEFICSCGRTSPCTASCYDDGGYTETYLKEQDKKLINYLAKHKHFSPFNHAFMTFRIKAPIFVARQLVKHKFMPWNEVSRRYVDEEPEFYWPNKWRAKADNVKQGSSDEPAEYMQKMQWNGEDNLQSGEETTEDLVSWHLHQSVNWYSDMIRNGVSAEQARMILPQNMMTEWMWSGTLGAYADMLKLRLDPHTQYESRIVAEKIVERVRELFPVSINALLENK